MDRARILCLFLTLGAISCDPSHPGTGRPAGSARDSGFAGVQARGEIAMGVNQYTSSHSFTPLADGGRIELRRDLDDSAGTAAIRQHMQRIATQFAAGDFQLPGFVHAEKVPGTDVMSARRERITYTAESLPRGAALRIRSADAVAIRAIHQFLAYQRQDHHAGATAQTPQSAADSVSTMVSVYDRAWNSRDTSAVQRILAPDYQYFTSRGGVASRAEALAMLASPEYVLTRARRSEVSVRMTEAVAVVASRWQGEGKYRGERFVDDQRCGQTWLRTGRSWQILSEHCVQIVPATSPPI
jgi:ketosteroid isomerase-like protein